MKTRFFALATLALSLVACTQDEAADDNRLPEGEYPVFIRATGLSVEATPQAAPSTRATVDGDWQGVTSVALKMGDAVKEYTATASTDFKSATLSRKNDPYYWTSRNPITVSAWWPFDNADITQMPAVKVAEDQSKLADFQNSDFISAENRKVEFNNPTLEFTHRTARVTIELKPGTGFTSVDGATVSLVSLSADNGNPTAIKTYNASGNTYEALTAPQTVAAGDPFIRVELGSGIFYFRPQSNVVLEAGSRYKYTVKVNATGLTLDGCTIGYWTDGGSEDVASISITNYTAADLKIGDYYYSDGTWSDGGLRKLYADGKMKWAETTPQPISGKTCIGIVFYTGRHETDRSDYTKPLSEDGPTIPNGKVNGYVAALTDVHDSRSDRLCWALGPSGEYDIRVGASTSTDDWQGYSNSLKFHEYVGSGSNAGWEMKHFPAALACETYGNRTVDQDGNPTDAYGWQQPLAAPQNTSGWFLPSCGQLTYLYQNSSILSARMNDVKNSIPDDCSYKVYIKWYDRYNYWSSTELWGHRSAHRVSFYNGHIDHNSMNFKWCVRPILAF